MKFFLVPFCLFICLSAYTNKDFINTFEIYEMVNQSGIRVEAKIHKSFIKSMEVYFPKLKKTKNINEFNQVLKVYIELNFIIKDLDGNKLNLISINKSRKEYFDSFERYYFFFDFGTIRSVKNVLFLKTSDKCVNQHYYYHINGFKFFETSNKNKESYIVYEEESQK